MTYNKTYATAGQPTAYTSEIGDFICDLTSKGNALEKIMPILKDEMGVDIQSRTVYNWLRSIPEFKENYTAAKEDQADAMVDKMMAIADDETLDPAHKKIMVETRKWAASKFKANKYSDRIVTEHSGSVNVIGGLYNAIAGKTDGIPE